MTRIDRLSHSQNHIHNPQERDPNVFAQQGYSITTQLDRDTSNESVEQARHWLEQAEALLLDPSLEETSALREQAHCVRSSLEEEITRLSEMQNKAESLCQQPSFLQLDRDIQATRQTDLNRVFENPAFRDLDPRLQNAVIESIASGRGTATDVMRAATFQFAEGIHTRANSEADASRTLYDNGDAEIRLFDRFGNFSTIQYKLGS